MGGEGRRGHLRRAVCSQPMRPPTTSTATPPCRLPGHGKEGASARRLVLGGYPAAGHPPSPDGSAARTTTARFNEPRTCRFHAGRHSKAAGAGYAVAWVTGRGADLWLKGASWTAKGDHDGNRWRAKGELEKAVADYGEAIRLNPQHVNALITRCWINAQLDRVAEALADCEASLKLALDSARGFEARAFVHLRARRDDAAIADYDAASRRAPPERSTVAGWRASARATATAPPATSPPPWRSARPSRRNRRRSA